MARIPRISLREGLARYRSDRLGLLRTLGEERASIVESVLGPPRLIIVTDAELAREVLVQHAGKLTKGPAISRHAAPGTPTTWSVKPRQCSTAGGAGHAPGTSSARCSS